MAASEIWGSDAYNVRPAIDARGSAAYPSYLIDDTFAQQQQQHQQPGVAAATRTVHLPSLPPGTQAGDLTLLVSQGALEEIWMHPSGTHAALTFLSSQSAARFTHEARHGGLEVVPAKAEPYDESVLSWVRKGASRCVVVERRPIRDDPIGAPVRTCDGVLESEDDLLRPPAAPYRITTGESVEIAELRAALETLFGDIESVILLRQPQRAVVHFLSIHSAIACVTDSTSSIGKSLNARFGIDKCEEERGYRAPSPQPPPPPSHHFHPQQQHQHQQQQQYHYQQQQQHLRVPGSRNRSASTGSSNGSILSSDSFVQYAVYAAPSGGISHHHHQQQQQQQQQASAGSDDFGGRPPFPRGMATSLPPPPVLPLLPGASGGLAGNPYALATLVGSSAPLESLQNDPVVMGIENNTIYLGGLHPETSCEDICNAVRGGNLYNLKYMDDKNCCFVTFIHAASASAFYTRSMKQGLVIKNRRLKIGWGKPMPIPDEVFLYLSRGASRNVYIGNVDDFVTEDRLHRDFSEFGRIEKVDVVREKSMAFVNYTSFVRAIRAVEGMRGREGWARYKINFGKDRCANPPKQFPQTQAQASATAGQPRDGQPSQVPAEPQAEAQSSTQPQSQPFFSQEELLPVRPPLPLAPSVHMEEQTHHTWPLAPAPYPSRDLADFFERTPNVTRKVSISSTIEAAGPPLHDFDAAEKSSERAKKSRSSTSSSVFAAPIGKPRQSITLPSFSGNLIKRYVELYGEPNFDTLSMDEFEDKLKHMSSGARAHGRTGTGGAKLPLPRLETSHLPRGSGSLSAGAALSPAVTAEGDEGEEGRDENELGNGRFPPNGFSFGSRLHLPVLSDGQGSQQGGKEDREEASTAVNLTSAASARGLPCPQPQTSATGSRSSRHSSELDLELGLGLDLDLGIDISIGLEMEAEGMANAPVNFLGGNPTPPLERSMLGKQNAFGGSAMSLGKEALSRQRSYSAAASIGSELSNGGGGGSATPLEQQKQTKKVQKQQQQQQKQKQQVPSAQNSLNTADDPLHVVNAGLASLVLQRATGGDALGSSGGTKQPKKKEQQSSVVEHGLPAPARATSRNGSRNSGFFSKWF